MSLQQPLYSLPKLVYAILTKKAYSLEQFESHSISLYGMYANEQHLVRFTESFSEPDNIPTFAFITAFKASLQCLAQTKIPSSLLGLIHLSSEFQLHNKHNWLMPFNLKISVNQCEQTDKGLVYTVTTDFFQRGKLTITNVNLMLDKSRKYRSEQSPDKTKAQQTEQALEPICSWPISMNTAWQYVKTSGDFNPIHLHPVLAKKFGLPNALIHGMYNASMSLQALWQRDVAFGNKIVIEFNRPCFIPNQVHLKQYGESAEYGLFSADGKDRFLKLSLHQPG